MKTIFKEMGWQHFHFTVPENWDIVEEHGNTWKGYLRLATLEENTLELKWQKITSIHNILELITKHLKTIGWEDRKIQRLNPQHTIFLVESLESNLHQHLLFFAPSQKNRRLAIARVFTDPQKNTTQILKKIHQSFADELFLENSHWRFYECSYHIPSFYHKVAATIQAGNKELILNYGHRVLYAWTISLVSHFCPHKPLSKETINLWILDLLKKKFNKELRASQSFFLQDHITYTQTSFVGRLLFRNLFHLVHQWAIIAKYHSTTDQLKIVILNFRNKKELQRFPDFTRLAD